MDECQCRAVRRRASGGCGALLAMVMLSSGGARAESARPPAGVSIDQSSEVRLLRMVPEPCLSIAMDGALVLLPSRAIETLARSKPAARWRTETERLARIESDRANELQLDHTSWSAVQSSSKDGPAQTAAPPPYQWSCARSRPTTKRVEITRWDQLR